MSLSENKATQRIYFGHYAYITGPLGDVFQYLLRNKIHSKRTGKKMALQAISAFWKPFSAERLLDLDEHEARAIAIHSIDELQSQIELIRRTFNIKQSPTLAMTKQDIEQMIDARLYRQNQKSGQQERPAKLIPVPDNYNE